jgi:hypothetical protein
MKNKIQIGLLSLLLVALLFAPGTTATPSKTSACTGCHGLGLSLSITNIAASSTTVAPSQVFNVDVTWTGGDSSGSTTVKWLTISANNNQFSFNPVQRDGGASAGTASFAVTAPATPGTYKIGVYATTGPNAMETDYKEVIMTVSPPVVIPVLKTITVTPATASVLVGATQAFVATPKDQNGNPIAATITWTSSNSTVGTINAAGTFTALAAGTTTVKAANGTVNGTATITVTAPVVIPVLKTITVTPPTASVLVGATQAFVATPKDQNGNTIAATITWTSSNSTVGTINAAGSFTALAAGTTTVKATSGSVSGTAAVTVTATPPLTGKFSVTFIVTDSLTGKPISNAEVSLKGEDIKTNNAGKAIFTNVASGTYEYNIEKDGYREIEGKITVARETTIALKLVKKSPRRTYYTRSHD